jgi:hypothetical protein
MLLTKPKSQGDVITLKLTSGEEIIARYEEDTASGVKISKPMVLSMTSQGVGMMPYLFTVHPDTFITVEHTAISVVALTDEGFAKQYMTGTTGIQMA